MKKTEEVNETKKEVESVNAENINKTDDEPSWYHYVIVLLVLALIVFVPYYTYEYFFNTNKVQINESLITYKYPYVVGNVTYNLYFATSIEEVEKSEFDIQPDKYDILNTIKFQMVFSEYNGSDNGYVAKGSTKLSGFLRFVYHFQFQQEDFMLINETNCSASTQARKIIYFDPYSDRNGVFMDKNGCIGFETDNAEKMENLVDRFIYEMIDVENVKR